MKIVLADISQPMVDAWIHRSKYIHHPFDNGTELIIKQGSIFDIPCDAIVSPANSFGFMGGGLDGVISKTLGWHIQARVQKKIKEEFDGELLVGQSLVVPTDNKNFPYLISAPTMRVSMNISGTPNVYLAAKAIFIALKKNPYIQSVAIPGLGTGVGGVTPFDCASNMFDAYVDFYLGRYEFPESLYDAGMKHLDEIKVQPLNAEAK